jgi:hypothetical protein
MPLLPHCHYSNATYEWLCWSEKTN